MSRNFGAFARWYKEKQAFDVDWLPAAALADGEQHTADSSGAYTATWYDNAGLEKKSGQQQPLPLERQQSEGIW